MSKHLKEAREALETAFESATGYVTVDLVRDAMAALSAHEEVVRELVSAVGPFLQGTEWLKEPDFERLRAALRPFTGDDK